MHKQVVPPPLILSVMMSFFDTAAILVLFLVGVVPAAHAYLDPGTGSFIIQTLIAALFGAIFVLKSYWIRIKSWLSGSRCASEDSADTETPERLADSISSSEAGEGAKPELPKVSADSSAAGKITQEADLKSDE